MDLLNEILNTPSSVPSEAQMPLDGARLGDGESMAGSQAQSHGGFMPSDLLEITSMMSDMPTGL